jgi:hypothetical protein
MRAFRSKPFRNRQPDADASAGDDGHFAFQSEIHPALPWPYPFVVMPGLDSVIHSERLPDCDGH